MTFPVFGLIGDIGGPELMLIFALVLLLFGGKRLPEFARGLGKSIREFKKATSSVEEEIKRAMEEPPPKRRPAALAAPATQAALPAPATEGVIDPDHHIDYHSDYHDSLPETHATPDPSHAVDPTIPPEDPQPPVVPAAKPKDDDLHH